MRMYDIITKKRDKEELTKEEINFFVEGYVRGEIPDYQASAMLMAIYLNGLNERETTDLTMSMAYSGEVMDLSAIDGIKVDKHSTGGVGDKTTLIIAPIVASLGVKVAKMSGRGLGHTGGTIDKLESIPGFKTAIDKQEFFKIVNRVGLSLVSQTGNLVPADKKIYALRDVTATVDSIPLIASSIMSKKIAAGSDCILLDVKVGNGAFMKTIDDAIKLSSLMVKIGQNVNKKTIALITDMNIPLGNAIGNSLEVLEVLKILKGRGPYDLKNICIELAANMLHLANSLPINECKKLAADSLKTGAALSKFKEMISAQGGNTSFIDDIDVLKKPSVKYQITAPKSGYINSMNTQKCGSAAMLLGAGRETKNSVIDYSAGIILNKKVGDFVNSGDLLATFYSNDIQKCKIAENIFIDSLVFSDSKPFALPLIHARVSSRGVTY